MHRLRFRPPARRSGRARRARSRNAALGLALAAALARALPAAGDEPLFELVEIPSTGRTVAAELVDLDGDGRRDLFQVAVLGIPPEESRFVRLAFQRADGSFPSTPDRVMPLPAGAVAYDVADLRETPGEEIVLLRADGVTVLNLGPTTRARWDLRTPGATTAGPVQDERGLERLQLVWLAGPAEPWIWVPQLGETTALSPTGEVRARLAIGGRANYYIPPRPGLVFTESDLQIFYDAPRLAMGDVDGDGRLDVVTVTRHELFVFLRREDGSLPRDPDRRIPLHRMEMRDHLRASGGVSTDVRDIDGDGRVDLLVSHVKGSVADATTRVTVHMNRGGTWDLEKADAEFDSDSAIVSNVLVDLDGDRRLELLRMRIAFSILEVIETLMSQEVDVELDIHRYDPEKTFAAEPWAHRKLEVAWSFDTFRPKGFVPTIFEDWNADGFLDFAASGEGDRFEVWLGGRDRRYDRRSGRQFFDTSGVIRTADLDGDGLTDFVIHDPHRLDAPVRIGRNLGALPGSPPRLERAGKKP